MLFSVDVVDACILRETALLNNLAVFGLIHRPSIVIKCDPIETPALT